MIKEQTRSKFASLSFMTGLFVSWLRLPKAALTVLLLSALGLSALPHQAHAQIQALSATQSSQKKVKLRIANVSQCAADSVQPTESLFLYINSENIGRIANAIASQRNYEKGEFIDRAIKAYQNRLVTLSLRILSALRAEQLPLIRKTPVDLSIVQSIKNCKEGRGCAEYQSLMQGRLGYAQIESPYFVEDDISCLAVEKFTSRQADLFLHGVNAENLTALAESYTKDKDSTLSCKAQLQKKEVKTYFLAELDANPEDSKKFAQEGFEFWNSFKIYLSAAWKYVQLPEDDVLFRKIFLSLAFEEDLILVPNGCRSITPPACNTDFLTSSGIRDLAIKVQEVDPIAINSEELRARTFVQDTKSDKIEGSIAEDIAENQWLKNLHKSVRAFSWGLSTELRKTQQFFQTLLVQKGLDKLITDLNASLDERPRDRELLRQFHYMCLENNLLGDPQFSFYRFDLNNLDKFSSQQFSKNYDIISPSQIVKVYFDFDQKIRSVCERANQLAVNMNLQVKNLAGHRPWFKRYLQQFTLAKSLTEEEVRQEAYEEPVEKAAELAYLKISSLNTKETDYIFCSSPINCSRTLIESVAQLNRIALNSKAFLSGGISEAPVFSRGADKVACGMFNPWEKAEQARKKLFFDVLSSAVFSWSYLPIYIDVNYKPRELVSFQKLIEDGTIKFDTRYDSNKLTATLIANFGNLLGAPCSVSISETEKAEMPQPILAFKGISIGACSADQKSTFDLSDAKTIGESYKKTNNGSLATCGQCSLNFENVAYNTAKGFAPIRFIVRLIDSIFKFSNSKDDPSIPKVQEVNLEYLMRTYQDYGKIPEECVEPLSKGLPCQSNMCLAKAAKEIEAKTKLRVAKLRSYRSARQRFDGEAFIAGIEFKECKVQVYTKLACSFDDEFEKVEIIDSRTLKKCLAEIEQKEANK